MTFRYTVGESGQTRYCTLPAEAFIRRFRQHILPKGFVKMRYYGLFRMGNRQLLAHMRGQLLLQQRTAELQLLAPASDVLVTAHLLVCPRCGQPMRLERVLRPHNRGPPSRMHQILRQHMGRRWRLAAGLATRRRVSACSAWATTTRPRRA